MRPSSRCHHQLLHLLLLCLFARPSLQQTADFDIFSVPTENQVVPAGTLFDIRWYPSPAPQDGNITIGLIHGASGSDTIEALTLGSGIGAAAGKWTWTVPGPADWTVSDFQYPVYVLRIQLGTNTSTTYSLSPQFNISGIKLASAIPTFASTTASLPSSSSTSTHATTTPSSTTSASSTSVSKSGLSTGAKAGIAIGATLIAFLLIAFFVLFLRRRARQRRLRNATELPSHQEPTLDHSHVDAQERAERATKDADSKPNVVLLHEAGLGFENETSFEPVEADSSPVLVRDAEKWKREKGGMAHGNGENGNVEEGVYPYVDFPRDAAAMGGCEGGGGGNADLYQYAVTHPSPQPYPYPTDGGGGGIPLASPVSPESSTRIEDLRRQLAGVRRDEASLEAETIMVPESTSGSGMRGVKKPLSDENFGALKDRLDKVRRDKERLARLQELEELEGRLKEEIMAETSRRSGTP